MATSLSMLNGFVLGFFASMIRAYLVHHPTVRPFSQLGFDKMQAGCRTHPLTPITTPSAMVIGSVHRARLPALLIVIDALRSRNCVRPPPMPSKELERV